MHWALKLKINTMTITNTPLDIENNMRRKFRNSISAKYVIPRQWSSAIIVSICLSQTGAMRLHKLFQFVDGFMSHYELRGVLHLGVDYAVFLQVPKPHDRFLVYELYETRKDNQVTENKPRVLAISKVPIEYIKEQLKIYRQELYRAKYVDENVVPGTEVKTLREWQIDTAVNGGLNINKKLNVLRSIV